MYVGVINQSERPLRDERNRNEILSDLNSKELLDAIGEGSMDYGEPGRGKIYDLQKGQGHHRLDVSNESLGGRRPKGQHHLVTEVQNTASALSQQLRESKESST